MHATVCWQHSLLAQAAAEWAVDFMGTDLPALSCGSLHDAYMLSGGQTCAIQ